jgi:type II secretory ATPase GspE/PulE/Tfp pilus assembly ATPase PilB-like protein
MRSFLRADPDVIMVGEMRDKETASTGVEASLTGHLVFSTLHTNSAPETITRLVDMGLDPFSFADALLGVLAQRTPVRAFGSSFGTVRAFIVSPWSDESLIGPGHGLSSLVAVMVTSSR